MTTELVLLLGLFAFLMGGVFFGDKGPIKVFQKSAPHLAARMEKHITIGREFKAKNGAYNQWEKPDGGAPDGKIK